MSAMTGIGDRRTISGSAFASSSFGNGDADDLAAGGRKRGDLRRRRLDVVRLRERHRLDDDRRSAADRDAPHPDLMRAGHAVVRVPGDVARPASPDDVAHRATARRPPGRPLGRRRRPRAGDARRRVRRRPLPHAASRDARLVLTRASRRRAARALRPVALAPPCLRQVRAPRRHGLRRRRLRLRATRRAGELDRRGRHRRVRPPARVRRGALRRGLGRRGAGRRALRRRARGPVRRRVDVPPAHGCARRRRSSASSSCSAARATPTVGSWTSSGSRRTSNRWAPWK